MTKNETTLRPSHHLYAVTKREGTDKGHWTRIGAAWRNGDGRASASSST